MHISTLVLNNFKSFGRKTEIPFYDDFTSVSGPNGTGKSNIIDAVLFALGLARSTGIRAEKLTDLIYTPGGEDDRGDDGPNEASVEVVLDNRDRTLSRDQVVAAAGSDEIGGVDEISIKRRVKQTDENYYSYYYLNGRSVNLSDIRDLLGQAGVTPEGYNVVMQGDVTEIISTTPYRRREIIDEIAGVAEFDAKRADAIDELEVVKERVDEAQLRIEEKRSRLSQLEDERETALEYQGLREEKADYESHLQAAELEEKRADLRGTRRDIERREAELDELQRELDERAGRVSRLEDELRDLNREIERKGEDEQLAIRREIEEVKGEIARLEGEVRATNERIDEVESRRRQAFVEIDRKQETLDELEDEIRRQKLEKASVVADLEERRADLESVEAEIDSIGEEYEDLKTDLDEAKAELEAQKTAKNDLQREQDRLLDEARRRSNEQADIEADLEAARDRIAELDAEIDDLGTERASAEAEIGAIDEAIDDLQAEKSERQADLDRVEDDLQSKRAEYAELEANATATGDSSWPRSVSAILNADIEGVRGAVGQLGDVAEQYATACETAAGNRLANVVVEDDSIGQACIEHLKRNDAGRATFLPMTEMDDRGLPELPQREGVIDFAYNLVEFDEAYADVFSYVLGDTVVVDTLATARALMGRYRLVTLSGDLVERSGAMTGGSTAGTRFSFAGGEGRIARVAEEIERLEAERRDVRDDIAAIDDRIEDARERRSAAAEGLRSIETAVEDVEREREEIEGRIERLEVRLEEIEDERAAVDERMGDLESRIAEHDATIDELDAEIAELESALSESHIPELTAESEEIEAAIDDLVDRRNGIDARLNELQLEQGYAEDAVDELHETIESAQNRKAEAEEHIEELEAGIEECEARLEEKEAAVDALEEELADLKAERESLRDDLEAAKADRDEQAEAVAGVENRLESLEAAAGRLEAEIAELEQAVEDYDPDEVPDHDEVRANIDRLERAMERLEPVNMLAIDEYDAVEAELLDLEERKATLVEEREGIRERIDRYEAQKKETFMAAFEGIDEHFQDIFERLSDGSGELLLENEDDPFEGGLTMRAKPGDKPVQRLNAMSGGEKSLTALAFIFAIQRFNPAPFYALDEIDAFLDAANAERVGEMLDELADDAQFIVVTHRSAMLERSERAIGVTMRENNVSTVTGIAIADGGAAAGGSAGD